MVVRSASCPLGGSRTSPKWNGGLSSEKKAAWGGYESLLKESGNFEISALNPINLIRQAAKKTHSSTSKAFLQGTDDLQDSPLSTPKNHLL